MFSIKEPTYAEHYSKMVGMKVLIVHFYFFTSSIIISMDSFSFPIFMDLFSAVSVIRISLKYDALEF